MMTDRPGGGQGGMRYAKGMALDHADGLMVYLGHMAYSANKNR